MLTKSVKKNSLIFYVSRTDHLSSVCSCRVSFLISNTGLCSLLHSIIVVGIHRLYGDINLNLKFNTSQEIYEHRQSFPKFNLHNTNKIYRPTMITFYLTINRNEISALTIHLLQLEPTIHKHCGDMEKANGKLKP